MSGASLALVALAAACIVLAGCESTQDKAKKLRASGSSAFSARGLRIGKPSREVRARGQVLQDKNGVAVAVVLHNTSPKALAQVPIAVDVRDRRGKSLFRNDNPGVERSLVGVSLLGPRQELVWVNDQVLAGGRAAKARVKVGQARPAPRSVPALQVTRPRFERDPVSGVSAVGKVTNRSRVLQRKLVLYAVARKGRRIVAVGRGGIERLRPGRKAGYQIFFIGNPDGARLTIAAPPTSFAS